MLLFTASARAEHDSERVFAAGTNWPYTCHEQLL